eukprot:2564598-Pyramimonas_sp.AAC.1
MAAAPPRDRPPSPHVHGHSLSHEQMSERMCHGSSSKQSNRTSPSSSSLYLPPRWSSATTM